MVAVVDCGSYYILCTQTELPKLVDWEVQWKTVLSFSIEGQNQHLHNVDARNSHGSGGCSKKQVLLNYLDNMAE